MLGQKGSHPHCPKIVKEPGFVGNMFPETIQDQAEDITNEVFEAVFHAMPTFRHESSIKTWLLKIAKYTCLNALAKLKTRAIGPRKDHDDAQNTTDDFMKHEQWNIVKQSLAKLSLEDRLIIALRFFEGRLGPQEIAEILEIQKDTLRQKYGRAMKRLRKIVEDHENP